MEGGVAIILLLIVAAVVVAVGLMLYLSAQAGRHGAEGDLNDDRGRRARRPEHHEVHNEEEPRAV